MKKWIPLVVVLGLAPRPQRALAAEEVVVFAAASLKEVMTELGAAFEKGHPGVKVQLNLAGSQELRTQIEQGARADVLAAADLETATLLEKALGRPVVFARNEPVIVVPKANPAGIRAFADLGKAKRLVIGAPEVPIGGYTVRIFEAAGKKLGPDFKAKVEGAVVSRELNVRQVLAKVTLGEADAGIVYRTDALAAKDKVEVIAIPAEINVVADYPIAPLKASKQPELAKAFIALVLSPEGQRRFAAAGFVAAPPAPAAEKVGTGAQVPAR